VTDLDHLPATGTYSAKQYDGPSAAEVMSRSMEFLADPNAAKQLLAQDPLQAAIILRGSPRRTSRPRGQGRCGRCCHRDRRREPAQPGKVW
jgi:hypothetical protein